MDIEETSISDTMSVIRQNVGNVKRFMEEYGRDMPSTLNSFLNGELFGCLYVLGNPTSKNYMCLFDTQIDMNEVREDNFENYANKAFGDVMKYGMLRDNLPRV